MSTIVRASCPMCGPVDLVPADVTLTLYDPTGNPSYRFLCPICSVTVQKPACASTVALLLSASTPTEVLLVPDEALEPHSGPAFCLDDLIDWHFELQRTD